MRSANKPISEQSRTVRCPKSSNAAKRLVIALVGALLAVFSPSGIAQGFSLYALQPNPDSSNTLLVALNPTDASKRTIGSTEIVGMSNPLVFDPVSGAFFGVTLPSGDPSTPEVRLIRIDPTTGRGTSIGSIGMSGNPQSPGYLGESVVGLTVGPNGRLLGLTNDQPFNSGARLIDIDRQTGRATLAGPFPPVRGFGVGLAYQPAIDPAKVIFTQRDLGSVVILTMDLSSGALTEIGRSNPFTVVDVADPNSADLWATWNSVDFGQFLVRISLSQGNELRIGQIAPPFGAGAVGQLAVGPATLPAERVLFSTYLGGPGGTFTTQTDVAHLVRADKAGATYVLGVPGTDFPLVNAIQTERFDDADVFLTKFDASGQVAFSTYLGGSGLLNFSGDWSSALAVDQSGNIYVGIDSRNSFWPLIQETVNGGLLLKLNPTGSQVLFARQLRFGGPSGPPATVEHIRLDSLGNVIVMGRAGFDLGSPNTLDDYVAKYTPDGQLLWERDLFGIVSFNYPGISGCGGCHIRDIDVDAAGNIYGITPVLPQLGVQPTHPIPGLQLGGEDIVVFRLDPDGQLLNRTLLGGSGDDVPERIAVSPGGEVTVLGNTSSLSNYPITPGAYHAQPTGACNPPQFLTKLRFTDGDASLVASTFLDCEVRATDISLGLGSDVWIAARVEVSDLFPPDSAPLRDPLFSDGSLWVGRISADLKQLVFGSRFGGTIQGPSQAGGQAANRIAAGEDGSATVVGHTDRADFPTSANTITQFPSFQPAFGGGHRDAFVLKIRPSGTQPPAQIALDKTALDFGSAQPLGTTSPAQTVTTRNPGGANLTIGTIGLSGANPGDFRITANPCNGLTLAPNDTCAFSVAFSPLTVGARTALVTVSSNAAGLPPTVSLAGNAVVAPSNTPPTVSLVSPASGGTFTAPATVTIQASASDADGTISQVQFFAEGTLLGTVTSSPFQFTWSNVSAGTYSLTARATDNRAAATTSATVSIVVNAPVAPPPTAGGPSSNPNTPFSFEPVNLVTGNYVLQTTDLAVPGRGFSLVATRTYNSSDATETPLGRGWRLSVHMRLAIGSGGDVIVVNEDGRSDRYQANAGLFTPPPGVFAGLARAPDGSYILTRKDKRRFEFDPNGRLLRILDRNANAQTLTYDAQGNLIQIMDTVGRIYALAYSGNRLSDITDPGGRSVRYTYDTQGLLEGVTNPNGETTVYEYGSDGLLRSITNALQERTVTNEYDAAGRVVRQIDALGNGTTFAYDPASRRTIETDPLGRVTVHRYDSGSRLIRRTDALGHEVQFTYDANNNRISVTEKNGGVTRFTYDSRGNLTSVRSPLGDSVTFDYDQADRLTRVTNARGFATTFTYDAPGNLTRVVDAASNATTCTYNSQGQRTRRTDARGNATRYGYDGHGNLNRITNAFSNTTALTHDQVGRLVSLTDPKGQTANATYDAFGRLIRITDPLGHQSTFGYDAAGRLVETRNPEGRVTRYGYDANGNLIGVTDALGHVTRYAYDAANNRVGFTDANNHTTAYEFDAVNRLAQVTDPLGHANRYTYDPNGNVVSATDAKGATSTVDYDINGRLARIIYGDGTSVAYEYDPNGNRTAMSDARGRTTYEYDVLDRPIRIQHPDGAVGYAYDSTGNRARLTYPDGKAVSYAYDVVNRLGRVTDWNEQTTTYNYDSAGNLTGVNYPNGVAASYAYDRGNRLTEVAYMRSAKVIDRLTYALDELGNRTTVTRDNPAVALPYSTENYSYDALSQLVRVDKVAKGSPLLRTEYVYDSVGNRLTLSESRQVGQGWRQESMSEYRYDAANRLLAAGKTAFSYDNNGNRVTEVRGDGLRRTYAYDGANRLIAVAETSTQLPLPRESRYAYDGDGNKVSQTVTGVGSPTTTFLSDVAAGLPVTLVESSRERDVAYTHGLGLLSMDRRPDAGLLGTLYYHPDGLGSTVAMTGTGGVRSFYRYDTWGNLDKKLEAAPTRFRFTGQDEDPVTGLYYLRARWYDPNTGRYVQSDPIGVLGATRNPIRARTRIDELDLLAERALRFFDNPVAYIALSQRAIAEGGLNLYGYAEQNPLRFIDPFGLEPFSQANKNRPGERPGRERPEGESGGTSGSPGSPGLSPAQIAQCNACRSDNMKLCLIGGGVCAVGICGLATTTIVGGVACAATASTAVGGSCWYLTDLYCSSVCGGK